MNLRAPKAPSSSMKITPPPPRMMTMQHLRNTRHLPNIELRPLAWMQAIAHVAGASHSRLLNPSPLASIHIDLR